MKNANQKHTQKIPLKTDPDQKVDVRTNETLRTDAVPQSLPDAPFDRILLPLDGSLHSQQVLGVSEDGLLRKGTEVHLLRVLVPRIVPDELPEPQDERDARQYLDHVRERLEGGGAEVHVHVERGEPAEEILSLQDSLQPCLTAMSTHGRTGPARWIIGSVAERVLRHSEQPVLLLNPTEELDAEAPAAPEGRPFQNVLVPLDGSARSSQILPLAHWFAARFGSRIVLLHCPRTGLIDDLMEMDRRSLSLHRGETMLEQYRRNLERAGVDVETRVGDLPPAVEILRIVEHEEFDLVAMTTHGRTGLSRWAFGSVAEKVIHNSPVPVLVRRTVTFEKLAEEAGAIPSGARS